VTLAGWIFMLCSLLLVLGASIFCYARVLSSSAATEHMHAPLDIDTGDRQD